MTTLDRDGTDVARYASLGHVAWIGETEIFWRGKDLYRAPASNPLDVEGYRLGGRFFSTAAAAEDLIARALADLTGAEVAWYRPEAARLLAKAAG